MYYTMMTNFIVGECTETLYCFTENTKHKKGTEDTVMYSGFRW